MAIPGFFEKPLIVACATTICACDQIPKFRYATATIRLAAGYGASSTIQALPNPLRPLIGRIPHPSAMR